MDSHAEQSSETDCEAVMAGEPQFADLMAELDSIVGRLESDLRDGRAADLRCADDLHRLRVRAECFFPKN
jgi:hypothetical protein